jgi:hypothetical protein
MVSRYSNAVSPACRAPYRINIMRSVYVLIERRGEV